MTSHPKAEREPAVLPVLNLGPLPVGGSLGFIHPMESDSPDCIIRPREKEQNQTHTRYLRRQLGKEDGQLLNITVNTNVKWKSSVPPQETDPHLVFTVCLPGADATSKKTPQGAKVGQRPTLASELPSPACMTPPEEEGGQEGLGLSQPHSVASAHLHSCPRSRCRPPAPRASCRTLRATAVLCSGLKKRKKKIICRL